ncbi:hypothetical protein QAD02_010359 [Eretmocerus hayati]|uniref:Uncharacterized protein n=1 Tax=Eretmocerus hayati TaxID=131215 RepID=A0ACC2NDG0_9HYME|nr:hypothetical protein QAD02_010359 [Eretmocerus hayati]
MAENAQNKKNLAWADCCEDWGGYMAAKKAKLQEQFQEAARNEFSDPTSIFNGIAIFVNGYTNPTADELKRLMMAHGGIYHHYLRHSTTHMIASNLPYSKIVAYKKAQNPLPLCKPEWITESIKAGRVLDFRNYLLYSQVSKVQPDIFSHITRQVKERIETQTTSCDTNTATTEPVEKLDQSKTSADKKSQPKLQTTLNMDNPSVISNCTKNPEFLTEFYNNSRLHHISTMGAMFKDYVNELRDKSDGNFPGLEELKKRHDMRYSKPGPSTKTDDPESDDELSLNSFHGSASTSPLAERSRVVMHIDMDCFFVSVGLRNNPELRGLPVAVAHAKGNKQNTGNDTEELESMSEIASCSYEARKAGVKNGMFLGQALKLCPNLKTIRYDFEGYKEVSHILYNTVASYTLNIEAVSCDEMYADCTKLLRCTGLTALEFATILRNEIKEKTGCPVSTGFGMNKLQARLATKKAKPDGQYHLKGDDVKHFIRTLSVRDLPGVGHSTSRKLDQVFKVRSCGDLEKVSLFQLQKEFGQKNGQQLHDMCRGIDHNKLSLEHVRKSVSAEVNYGIRFENANDARDFLQKLSDEVTDRLKKINLKGKCITLKVMFRAKEAPIVTKKFMGHGICDVINKSKNLVAFTDDRVIITREVLHLWDQMNEKPENARGIGIQITKLESTKGKTSGGTLFNFIDKMKGSLASTEDSKEVHSEPENEEKSSINLQCQSRSSDDNLSNQNSGLQSIHGSPLSPENQVSNESKSVSEKSDGNILKQNATHSDSYEKINEFDRKDRDKSAIEAEVKNYGHLKQTTHTEFFKKTKSSTSNREGKVKMPDINEIDVKVLIELPEDIRNEIFNEYARNNESDSFSNDSPSYDKFEEIYAEKHKTPEKNVNVNRGRNFPHGKSVFNTNDISFSQVDPEFLAALPNDMKNEVKSYCDAQKKEKTLPMERKTNNTNMKWGISKADKKFNKSKVGRPKGLKSTKKETKKTVQLNIRNAKETKCNTAKSDEDQRIEENSLSRLNDNPALNQTIYFTPINGDPEHSEILSSLVNCLLNLPISQVKMQMTQWVNNSTDVNDVDFLSLTTYLGTLPRKKRLEDLHILLKCLYRCITESDKCVWHQTYAKILEHVQSRMRSEYGYGIMISESASCKKCENLNV